MADWGTISVNKIVTAQDLADAIAAGYFTGTFTGTQKAVKKSELLASNINYSPNNATLTAKVSNQLLAKTDISALVNKTWFNEIVYSLAIQPDGKILCGGNFTSYNGVSRNRIARLNSDGTLDTSFNIGSGFNYTVNSIAIQSDGKILCGGGFTSYNGVSCNYTIRLNSDGTIDTSFTIGTGFNGEVNSLVIQSDSKILVGGYFTLYNGVSRNRVVRLNLNGILDTSFDSSNGFNGIVTTVGVQSDGKVLCGGSFTSYGGVSRNYIARLNSNGTLDTSFTIGTGFNVMVYSLAIQSDGKILVGGDFYLFNGALRNYIARLNSNGTLDTSFNTYSYLYGIVRSLAIQSDGKILLGVPFTPSNYLVRLNSNSSFDSSFDVGSGFDSLIRAIAIQSDGKIICGGNFTYYNGSYRNYIARINSDGTLDTSF